MVLQTPKSQLHPRLSAWHYLFTFQPLLQDQLTPHGGLRAGPLASTVTFWLTFKIPGWSGSYPCLMEIKSGFRKLSWTFFFLPNFPEMPGLHCGHPKICARKLIEAIFSRIPKISGTKVPLLSVFSLNHVPQIPNLDEAERRNKDMYLIFFTHQPLFPSLLVLGKASTKSQTSQGKICFFLSDQIFFIKF